MDKRATKPANRVLIHSARGSLILINFLNSKNEKQNIIKDREDVAQRLDDQMHKFIINLIQI